MLLAYFIYAHPWSLGLKRPIIRVKVAGGLIAVISDLHLRDARSKVDPAINEFLLSMNVKYVIVAGDLFDRYHRGFDQRRLHLTLASTFGDLCKRGVNVYYVVSSSSHDPIPPKDVIKFLCYGSEILVVKGVLALEAEGLTLYVTHGDYASRNGFLARLIERVASALGQRLLLERRVKKALGIPQDSWLVMGHTHLPGVDYRRRVANCGAWQPHLFVKASKTLILFKGCKRPLLLSFTA